jgi:hypothetical protein
LLSQLKTTLEVETLLSMSVARAFQLLPARSESQKTQLGMFVPNGLFAKVRVALPLAAGEPVPTINAIVPPLLVFPVPIMQAGPVPPPAVKEQVGAVPLTFMDPTVSPRGN